MGYFIFIAFLLVLSIFMAMDLSWNNVLAAARNNMVFDQRHRDYGAFTLRRDYVRNLAMATAASIVLFGLVVAVPKIAAALQACQAYERQLLQRQVGSAWRQVKGAGDALQV